VVDRRNGEHGSALLLMPAAVLVMVVLASMSVDAAIQFRGQRDLVATAESAANDGAAVGIDLDALRSGGTLVYDRARIDRAVRAATAGSGDGLEVTWTLRGRTLEVRLRTTVHLLFAPAIDRGSRTRTLTARASAVLVVP
jgi:hypothetical protein